MHKYICRRMYICIDKHIWTFGRWFCIHRMHTGKSIETLLQRDGCSPDYGIKHLKQQHLSPLKNPKCKSASSLLEASIPQTSQSCSWATCTVQQGPNVLSKHPEKTEKVTNMLVRLRPASPRRATLACGLFWAEGHGDPAGSQEPLTSPLKRGGVLPIIRVITGNTFLWPTYRQEY